VFGTLTAYRDGLNEEDRAVYQSYYCGLCKTLREKFGLKSQLILTYDCTFLALLLHGLYEDPEEERTPFCAEKMGKVRAYANDSLSYAADMNLLLAYHNYRDKAHDEKKGKVHRAAALALRHLKKDYERVAASYPRQTAALERYMEALLAYEAEPDGNEDFAANLTGEMLAEIFDEKQDEFSGFLRKTGFFLGKFIYLSDAFEDVEADEKKGHYNPYRKAFREEGFDSRAEEHLLGVMGECTRYFEMLPIFEHREILRNILYSGIWIPFTHARLVRDKDRKNPENEMRVIDKTTGK